MAEASGRPAAAAPLSSYKKHKPQSPRGRPSGTNAAAGPKAPGLSNACPGTLAQKRCLSCPKMFDMYIQHQNGKWNPTPFERCRDCHLKSKGGRGRKPASLKMLQACEAIADPNAVPQVVGASHVGALTSHPKRRNRNRRTPPRLSKSITVPCRVQHPRMKIGIHIHVDGHRRTVAPK